MVQISFILQQLQMLQMQIAPDPKAKKRKESQDEETEGSTTQESTRSVFFKVKQDYSIPKTLQEENQTSKSNKPKTTVSADQLNTLFVPVESFMIPRESNKHFWTEYNENERAVNFPFWSNSMLFNEKVHQIEAVWAKRLFIDNNKTISEQKYK